MRSLIFLLILFFTKTSVAQDFWQQLKGPEGGNVGDLFEDSNGVFYLASNGCGIHRSVDKGKTWEEITSPFKYLNRPIFAFNSRNEIFFSSYGEGLQFSNDNGKSWGALNNQKFIDNIFIDKKDRIFIYKTYDVQFSTDGGKTFTDFIKGVCSFPSSVRGFYTDSDSTIYISTTNKIWSSIDGGQNWKIDSFGKTISQLWVNKAKIPFIIYNNEIYFSVNRGQNWEVLNTPTGPRTISKILTGDENVLYMSSYYGPVFRYELDIQNWNTITTNSPIYFQKYHLANDKNLYLSSQDVGLFLYDSNSTEIHSLYKGLYCQNILGIETSTKNTLFAITPIGIHRTIDDGYTWDLVTASLATYLDEQIMHVNKKNNDVYYVSKYNGLFKSTDDGTTWNKLNVCDTCDRITYIDGSEDGELYVGESKSLYKSIDDGMTWEKIYTMPTIYISYIYVDQKGRVFAGNPSRIYESTDKGLTWFDINSPKGFEIGVNKIFSDEEGNVFLVMMNLPIITSSDFGNSWNYLKGVIEQSYDFAILPNGDYMATGSDGRGSVLLSKDKGENWTSNTTGLNGDNSTFFTLDKEGYIYLGTYHTSIYKSTQTITGLTKVGNNKDAIQIYHANGLIHLTTESKYNQEFNLSIINLEGKQINTFTNQQMQSGKNEIEFQLHGLTPGIYYYQLASSNLVYFGKFVVTE